MLGGRWTVLGVTPTEGGGEAGRGVALRGTLTRKSLREWRGMQGLPICDCRLPIAERERPRVRDGSGDAEASTEAPGRGLNARRAVLGVPPADRRRRSWSGCRASRDADQNPLRECRGSGVECRVEEGQTQCQYKGL